MTGSTCARPSRFSRNPRTVWPGPPYCRVPGDRADHHPGPPPDLVQFRKGFAMKMRTILAAPIAIVAAGLLLSACGQGSQIAGTATISAAAAVDATAVKPVASLAETGALGQVLVGANGHTLYGFADDADGTSTCFDACATAWPAVTVQSAFLPPPGVDPALVSSVDRPDGSKQLKIGKWPVYFYAGDGAPGSADGQGVGGKWFAVGADGKLVKGDSAGAATPSAAAPAPAVAKPAAPAPANLAQAGALGQVLVGANGHTLYGFTDDANGTSTCFDACATAWPAVTVQSGFLPPKGVDPALVTTVDRPDGSKQLKIGKWPVYFYAGDGAPGSADGQGVGGKWFALSADGTLVKGDKAGAATPSAAASAAAAPAAKPASPAPASLAQAGALGQVLVGANGHTLYGFTDDANGTSTCFDACATAWPAVTVDAGFTLPAGVDPALVTTIDRPDGSKQLKIGKWPLYFYVGDGAPGETNGEGVGTKWFAVGADGKLVKGRADAAAPAPAAAPTQGPVVDLAQVGNLGEVMVGANGHTLYAFTDDPEGQTTCFDACAKAVSYTHL